MSNKNQLKATRLSDVTSDNGIPKSSTNTIGNPFYGKLKKKKLMYLEVEQLFQNPVVKCDSRDNPGVYYEVDSFSFVPKMNVLFGDKMLKQGIAYPWYHIIVDSSSDDFSLGGLVCYHADTEERLAAIVTSSPDYVEVPF